jgi:hypothetical protein
MPVLNVTPTLDDDVGVRLEQADQLLAGRHRPTVEHAALGLDEDARDQRQVMIDLGTQARDGRPGSFGQPCGNRLQLGPAGLGGGDQVAIEPALFVLAAAVLDGARPLSASRRRSRQRIAGVPGNPSARSSSRLMTRTASHSSVLSLGSWISALVTVLSNRTAAPLSSRSCLALASSAWLIASQVSARIAASCGAAPISLATTPGAGGQRRETRRNPQGERPVPRNSVGAAA